MKESAVLPMLLSQLRLPTVSRLWESLHQEAVRQGWTPARYLTALCEHELSHREDRRLKRNMAAAQLPRGKSLATFDFNALPSLNKSQIMGFASGDIWLKNADNLLIFGPSGVGKTHLAAAIGEKLVESGYRVFFSKTTDIVQKLQAAKRALTLPSALDKLDKYDCLILDDFGYVQKDQDETNVLFELICERYENKSLLITCNQVFAEWDKIFIDKTMAVAAADRLIHHATILELNVESYRKKAALARTNSQEAKLEAYTR
jgi:DNA replication protein DnaC